VSSVNELDQELLDEMEQHARNMRGNTALLRDLIEQLRENNSRLAEIVDVLGGEASRPKLVLADELNSAYAQGVADAKEHLTGVDPTHGSHEREGA